ncbi:MAG: hypothetical protein GF330_11335 [Candidatus Eisenbacteria bacterium]|nr:hypothetical protein [Candidatus Eisenbacteria bacterium]
MAGEKGQPMSRALTAVLALGLACGLVGCYTMLQHPQIQSQEVQAHATPSGSCLRCHTESSFASGAVPWVEYYGASTYPWINYYGSPWWYDSVWHWVDDDCVDCPPAEERSELSGRIGWGRRPRGGWSAERERERVSSGLAPISGAPAPAPVASPPAISSGAGGGDDSQASEEPPAKKEPRKRSIRR